MIENTFHYRYLEPLTAEEEKAIFERYNRANEEFKTRIEEEIMLRNMGLLRKLVRKFYSPNHPSFDDAISSGMMILIHAIRLFDTSKGYKFSTYAGRSIFRNVRKMKERESKDAHLEDWQWEEMPDSFDTTDDYFCDDFINRFEGNKELVKTLIDGFSVKTYGIQSGIGYNKAFEELDKLKDDITFLEFVYA